MILIAGSMITGGTDEEAISRGVFEAYDQLRGHPDRARHHRSPPGRHLVPRPPCPQGLVELGPAGKLPGGCVGEHLFATGRGEGVGLGVGVWSRVETRA